MPFYQPNLINLPGKESHCYSNKYGCTSQAINHRRWAVKTRAQIGTRINQAVNLPNEFVIPIGSSFLVIDEITSLPGLVGKRDYWKEAKKKKINVYINTPEERSTEKERSLINHPHLAKERNFLVQSSSTSTGSTSGNHYGMLQFVRALQPNTAVLHPFETGAILIKLLNNK